jgi:simple sugar transport system substrate-binding protein
MRDNVRHRGFLLLAIASIVLAACGASTPSASSGASPGGTEKSLSIYFVGLAQPSDAFHGYIYRGALQAGKDLGVKVTYIFPDQLTVPNYLQKVDEALLAKPDGMVMLGFAEESVFADAVAKAQAQGVVMGWNPASGTGLRPPDDPFVSRVGSDEASAGKLTGEQMLRLGVKGPVLVANGVPGDSTCAARTDNEVQAITAGGGKAEAIQMPQDANQAAEVVTTYLRTHTDVGGMTVTCGALSALLDAEKNVGRTGLLVSTYDIDQPTIDGIKSGTVAFTIDQQAWWRGYIPVMEVTQAIRYGLIQSNYFLTGPSIVDKGNIDKVSGLVTQGFR